MNSPKTMIIKRTLQDRIEKFLFKGKIIILYGARQVGKTTLVKEIIKKYPDDSLYLNCDEPDIRASLSSRTSTELKAFLGNKRIVVIDEAQQVKDISISLKLIVDNFPDVQVIATGSSSFELSDRLSEPLTGRKVEFTLYPLSLEELSSVYSQIELDRLLKTRIVNGMYPEIVLNSENTDVNLKSLAFSYSYKDVLKFQNIKNPEILERLLQALALQIGNEVSYNELSSLIGIDKNTVSNYIRILEQAFIIFRLQPFSRNLRSELKKLRKIYFYDTGIRNALINNLNPVELRQDTGAIWENFVISERIKLLRNNGIDKNFYFWRTKQKQEIDLIEEVGGQLSAFEIKWSKDRFKPSKVFIQTYPDARLFLISSNNYRESLLKIDTGTQKG